MPSTVFAETIPIATKGSDHAGLSEADPIKPGGKPPAKAYTNVAWSKDLDGGTCAAKTFYKQQPIWLEGSVIPTSEDAGGPPGIGEISQTWQMACIAKSTCTSVFIEGRKVIRLDDPTKQNNLNCDGTVVIGPKAKAALEEARKRGDSAPVGDAVKKPKAPQKNDAPVDPNAGKKDPKATKEGTGSSALATEAQCALKTSAITCEHGRKAEPQGAIALLEVVTKEGPDSLKLTCSLEKDCDKGKKHPLWTIVGAGGWTLDGTELIFPVPEYKLTLALGVTGMLRIWKATPRKHEITVEACKAPRKFEVLSYPGNEAEAKFQAEWLQEAVKGIAYIVGTVCQVEIEPKFLVGTAGFKTKWGEHTNNLAYCQFNWEIALDPVLGLEVKKPIVPVAITKLTSFLQGPLSKVGLSMPKIDCYIKLAGGFGLAGNGFFRTKGCGSGGSLRGEGKIGLYVGAEANIAKDVFKMEGEGGAEITIALGGEWTEDPGSFGIVDLLTFNGFKISLSIQIDVYVFEFSRNFEWELSALKFQTGFKINIIPEFGIQTLPAGYEIGGGG